MKSKLMICPVVDECKKECGGGHRVPHKKTKDCNNYEGCPDCIPYRPKRKPKAVKVKAWKLVTDSFGYASGISYRGETILHLNPGTVKNVEYGQKFINILNEKLTKSDYDKLRGRNDI